MRTGRKRTPPPPAGPRRDRRRAGRCREAFKSRHAAARAPGPPATDGPVHSSAVPARFLHLISGIHFRDSRRESLSRPSHTLTGGSMDAQTMEHLRTKLLNHHEMSLGRRGRLLAEQQGLAEAREAARLHGLVLFVFLVLLCFEALFVCLFLGLF